MDDESPRPLGDGGAGQKSLLDSLADARGLAGQFAQEVELGATHDTAALDFDPGHVGLCSGNTRSTPSPYDTLRTVKDELIPRFRAR